jgi:hypothetical protein
MHYETFREKWTLLNQEAREIATDPISVFSYFDIKMRALQSERKRKLAGKELEGIARIYWDVFQILGGERMGLVSETVDRYAKFYKAEGFAHYAITRPLRIASNSIIRSPVTLSDEDIKLQLIGEIREWISLVKKGRAKGYVPKEMKGQALMDAIEGFVSYFYGEIFKKYTEGDRSLLKKRINDFSSGCIAYYLMNCINWKQEGIKEEEGGEENVD